MQIRLLAVCALLLSIEAFADTPTCDVNLLQQRVELSLDQASHAEHSVSMPDVVTYATFDASAGSNANKTTATAEDASRNVTNATFDASAGSDANKTNVTAGDGSVNVTNATFDAGADSNAGATNVTAGNRSSNVDINITLPAREERLFDEMEKEFNESEHSLTSAEDLIDKFKKQTALVIEYGQKAALAEAQKLDALKQMDVLLNMSIRLERATSHGIPESASSLLPGKSAQAEKSLTKAAEDVAEAAKLAKVVGWAEGNYTSAIESALEATHKRNEISANMQSYLESTVMTELDLSRHVELINDTHFINLTGANVIEVSSPSGVNLTDIVQASIDNRYSSSTATSASKSVNSQPSVVVKIVKEEASDSDDNDKPYILPNAVYIIGLAFLLGIALAGIAIMRGH